MNKFRRANIHQQFRDLYYQIPKAVMELFIEKENFKALQLYIELYDRYKLSFDNGWYDENGDVYIIYTREEAMTRFNVSNKTIASWFQDLNDMDLIEEDKQFFGKPNRIYFRDFDDLTNAVLNRGEEKFTYGGEEKFTYGGEENFMSKHNKNNKNNNNINKKEITKESTTVDELFNIFWNAYPRKVGKANALKWFRDYKGSAKEKLHGEKLDINLVNKMVETINLFKTSRKWTDNGGQYIPHPTTWLNSGGWNDKLLPDEISKEAKEKRDQEASKKQMEAIGITVL